MGSAFIPEVMEESIMGNIEGSMNIYHLLTRVVLVPGDVVELGCYEGHTAIIMQKTLDQHESTKSLHVYDSFQGLPEKTPPRDPVGNRGMLRPGEMVASLEKLIDNFKRFDTKLPEIHKGWFSDTLPSELPDKICFAHLDGDFYSSIKESLEHVYPRLSPRSIVVIDDYYDPSIHKPMQRFMNNNTHNLIEGVQYQIENILPGVKAACDEFFSDKPESVSVLVSGRERQGYFVKE